MFKTFREKIALSGITVLMIGVALLVFTFISAYGFLTQNLSIMASENLVETFGEALAPLIATCVRIMYLGVMGWIGSLLTIRGVTIIAHAPQATPVVPQKGIVPEQKPQLQAQPQPQKEKAEKPKAEKPKGEVKPQEPEVVVIPPEQVSQPPPEPKQPQQNNAQQ